MKHIFLLALLAFTAPSAWALDLNTKPRNSDKNDYNVNPGVSIREGKLSVFSEFSYASNPLVIKNTTVTNGVTRNQINTLVDSLLTLEIGANYGINSWLQLGFVLPLEMPRGAVNDETYIGGALFEGKIKFAKHFALVPSFQLGSSGTITVNNQGQNTLIQMGAPNGTYGAKLVSEFGNINQGFSVAGYLGYYVSPDNVFSTIDQSSRVSFGVSGGVPVSDKVNAVVEFYGENTPSNTPLELMGLVNVKEESFNWQVGAGSGNLQASGSNDIKLFAAINFQFGDGPRTRQGRINMPQSSSVPAYEGQKVRMHQEKKNGKNKIKFEGLPTNMDQEQQGPDVLMPSPAKEPVIPDVEERTPQSTSKQEVVNRKLAALPSAEVVKEAGKKAYLVTLPNGDKAKVFPGNHVTELPSKSGVVYITEAEYKAALEAAKQETKAVAEQVKADLDPVPPVTAPKSEPIKIIPLVIVEKGQEKVVAPINAAPQKPEAVLATPVEVKTATPSAVENLKEILNIEFDMPLNQNSGISQKGREENEKLEAEIRRQQTERQKVVEQEIEQAKALARQKELTDLRENAPLSDYRAQPQAPASDKDLKGVRIDANSKKKTVIELPKTRGDAFLSNQPAPEVPYTPPSVEDLNILNENDTLEEANSPAYGFE